MIHFHLSSHSGVPPYLQIAQQVRQALQLGILQEGDQLPTVKEVTGMVAINPNTVFKAYRELEGEGLVKGRTGLGTFVLKRPSGPAPEAHSILAKKLAIWVSEAQTAGLTPGQIEALMYVALREGGNNETDTT